MNGFREVRLIDARARIARRISVRTDVCRTRECPYSTNYQKCCADTGCSRLAMDADQSGESSSASATTYLHTSGRKGCTVIIVPRSLATQHSTAIAIGITTYTPSSGFSPQTRIIMPVQDASESDSDSDAQEYEDGEALYYESIAPGLSLRASLYCSWPDRMHRAIASYASQGTLSFVQTACVG